MTYDIWEFRPLCNILYHILCSLMLRILILQVSLCSIFGKCRTHWPSSTLSMQLTNHRDEVLEMWYCFACSNQSPASLRKLQLRTRFVACHHSEAWLLSSLLMLQILLIVQDLLVLLCLLVHIVLIVLLYSLRMYFSIKMY